MRGIVRSVNTSPKGGIPKQPQTRGVKLCEFGLEGDYHNRSTRTSNRDPSITKVNLWHLSILAEEVVDEMNVDRALREMRILMPGSLGENLTVRGLGDLADIPDNTQIVVGTGVLLSVVEHMQPCSILAELHKKLPKQLLRGKRNRRGIYCRVESGVGERIFRGDRIEILR